MTRRPWFFVSQPIAAEMEVVRMTAVSAASARSALDRLIDQVNEESNPVTIAGRRGNAVLAGEGDWRAIRETLFPESMPGLTASIRATRDAGAEAGSTERDF